MQKKDSSIINLFVRGIFHEWRYWTMESTSKNKILSLNLLSSVQMTDFCIYWRILRIF